MESHEADRYLIEAVQRGESGAWREVIGRYQGRLLSFARRMLADQSEAEDVVQETFLGLLRSMPGYDRSRSLETYLFAIIRNKLHDHFRKTQKGQRESLEQVDEEGAVVDRDTPSRYLAGSEMLSGQRGALVAALRTWAGQCCEQHRFQDLVVIEMLIVLGLRNKEVASDLDLTETAVAGVKFRVLEQWRKLTQLSPQSRDWEEADLAASSTLARIWVEEGISCPKRSTLGRYLLGTMDDDWNEFIEFHVKTAGCDRCSANLDDLAAEDREAPAGGDALRERYFASSVGFLSQAPKTE
ncbi:ECF RNA polymerase sigma factor SigW [Phycisphaerae bacterium RAS1]|nr:ECF RNA polymerase sigma factor SigW [Phycisphaerae bacterium RAS1]